MTTPAPALLSPVEFEAPLVNPDATGLYAATTFRPDEAVARWLADGVRVRPHNYGGEGAIGVWATGWCGDPADELKTGTRPVLPDPFDPITAWAYDECDMTSASQAEVEQRVLQNLRIHEELVVEREFASRALLDAGTPVTAANIVEAVGKLEELIGATNTLGYLHASSRFAALAASQNLVIRSGTKLVSPLGHTWVFGGGYPPALGDTIVATSPTFGWRSTNETYRTFKTEWNQFAAIAERSVIIGYEKALGAVTVTTPTP